MRWCSGVAQVPVCDASPASRRRDPHEGVSAFDQSGGLEGFQGFGYKDRAAGRVDQLPDSPTSRAALKQKVEDDPLDAAGVAMERIGHELVDADVPCESALIPLGDVASAALSEGWLIDVGAGVVRLGPLIEAVGG
jgi:hypothetical protein